MNGFLLFVILLLITISITTQSQRVELQKILMNPCVFETNCGKCIALDGICAWCQKEAYTSERCDLPINHVNNGCDKPPDLVNPDNAMRILKNEYVGDSYWYHGAIQIQPQHISLKVRSNKPIKIPVKIRQTENYPVDLYFLMDGSYSMLDDKAFFSDLAHICAIEMLKLTNNVRFGFGMFVGKPLEMKEPCGDCNPEYTFRHLLTLTDNTTLFMNTVEKAEISRTMRSDSGGLAAMMQVAACGEKIGWRDVSRKILLYFSDGVFDSAKDSKLTGTVLPNDALCHIDHTGSYTESTAQGRPSMHQLREVFRQKKINTVFVVPRRYTNVYRGLAAFLEGSSVGMIAAGTSNIVNLVVRNYEKMSLTVELRAINTAGLTVLYHSACLGSKVRETNRCKGVKIGQEVTFDVEIEAQECPTDPALRRREIRIYPVGWIDSLKVDLEIICECECERQGVVNSQVCSAGNGMFACGVCVCNEGRYGRLCECDNTPQTEEDQQPNCRRHNSSLVCSGRGQCLCGKCHCFLQSTNPMVRFSGKYSECDAVSCDPSKQLLRGEPF